MCCDFTAEVNDLIFSFTWKYKNPKLKTTQSRKTRMKEDSVWSTFLYLIKHEKQRGQGVCVPKIVDHGNLSHYPCFRT